MLIREIPGATLASRLRGEGVHLVTGAFTIHLQIGLPHLIDEFSLMYADYPVEDPPGIDYARVRIAARSLLRRHVFPQANAWANGETPFDPIPAERAYTLLESAFNWIVASDDLAPLVLHSAVLERDGHALLMPAPTGSGKSTLCAALAWRGWRLMSDEMALFSLENGRLLANPRPVSLKNKAVEIIAAFEPRACLTRVYRDTPKGDVAYMRAPPAAVARAQEAAVPALVIAPTYIAGSATSLKPMSRIDGFHLLTDNAVNYSSLLRPGFDIVTGLVENCACYTLTYSNLAEAVELITNLQSELPARGNA